MKRFERVKEILDQSVNNSAFGAHGPFWRQLNLAAFVVKKVYGRQLVSPGQGAASNLVLALRGLGPFGSDVGTPNAVYPRMPAGLPSVPDAMIGFVEQWINDGCPDDDTPPTLP